MLHIIIADDKTFRAARVAEIVTQFGESEFISIDDTTISFPELEQFLYPSLFSYEVPVIHARFFLDKNEIDTGFIKKLATSPTVFLFEELTLPAAVVATFKKNGATVHSGEKAKIKKAATDIFAATACITGKDKKTRWLAYRSAVEKQPIEAILGILYWKIRALAAKENGKGKYSLLYKDMLEAQATAWRTGASLEAMIEKVILMQ